MKEWLKRFRNPGVLVSLVGAIGIVLQQFGVEVDQVWLNNTITAICTVLVILGIANDPNTNGLDTPVTAKKEDKPHW
jgi:phi LC3 family holin